MQFISRLVLFRQNNQLNSCLNEDSYDVIHSTNYVSKSVSITDHSFSQDFPRTRKETLRLNVTPEFKPIIYFWYIIYIHVASLLVFFLLPFRYFFFLIFFSRTKMISNPSKPWVDTQHRNCKHRCRPIKQSWNTHGINNYILISFGEIIRFTAANFFVFFILPWCK